MFICTLIYFLQHNQTTSKVGNVVVQHRFLAYILNNDLKHIQLDDCMHGTVQKQNNKYPIAKKSYNSWVWDFCHFPVTLAYYILVLL